MKIPLTFNEIADEIVRFTGLPQEEVEYRLWMEALQPGWNVLQDVAKFGVTPHKYDENMEQLYHDGDGFIFETLVFWLKPNRHRWTEHALERIQQYAMRSGSALADISVLIFGDGTGNDSLFLSNNGVIIDYYDVPGSKTFEFALKRFGYHGLLDHGINVIDEYQSVFLKKYDVIISFEVLEHLSHPEQMIHDVSLMLKYEGIALITDDFGDITNYLPTHLKKNEKLYGKTPFLFFNNEMVLSWYSKDDLFKPFEFVKPKKVSRKYFFHLLRDYNVRKAFLIRNSNTFLRLTARLPYIGQ